MPFFKIKDLAPGLDGLVVETLHPMEKNEFSPNYQQIMEVIKIFNPNKVFGEGTFSIPLVESGLFIHKDFLVKTTDPVKRFTTANPFKEFEFEGHYVKNDVQVDYARYSNGLSISVQDMKTKRTIYTQNYFDDWVVEAQEVVEDTLRGGADIDDLVFSLQVVADHQEEDNNGKERD